MSTELSDPATGCTVRLDVVRALTASHALCRMSAVHHLAVGGVSTDDPRELRLELPEAGIDIALPLSLFADGNTPPRQVLGRNAERLLDRVTDPQEVELRASVDGRELGAVPVTLLAADRWPHDRHSRRLVAAYSLPGDDRIAAVVHGASSAANRSLAELSLSGTPDTDTAVRALFEYLSECAAVEYEPPRVERTQSGVTYQRVLAPRAVVDTETGAGRGNCLDLSLFMAGALETLTLQPVLVFTGRAEDSPAHVFLGCWRERAERFRPVLNDPAELRRAAQRDDLLVVEATAVCTGRWRMKFAQACVAAREMLLREEVHAVDVAASRPPAGTVRPRVPGPDPVVQRALWLGEQFGDRLGASQRETIHLLYGVARSGGSLVTRVLERSGSSPAKVIALLEKALHPESSDGSPRVTKNYILCLDAARSHARNRGSASVEEADLLWGIVDNPSRNIAKALAAAGCNVALLREELGRWDSASAEVTLSRSFYARSEESSS